MMTIAAPGDALRISARNVTLLSSTYTEDPVTTGLTGTVEIVDWQDGESALGPTAISGSNDDDWFLDVVAPDIGHYRIVVVIEKSGAQRTLYGELRVKEPMT